MDLDPEFSTPPRPPPGFVPGKFDEKLPAWTGDAGEKKEEEGEKEKGKGEKEKGGGKGNEDGGDRMKDPTLSEIMHELRGLRLSVDNRMDRVESSVSSMESSLSLFRKDLNEMRSDNMLSLEIFQKLQYLLKMSKITVNSHVNFGQIYPH